MPLFRLAYTSKSLLNGDAEERRNVADILLTSRRNNEEAGVTGALLATEERFAQLLEGERTAVEEIYKRITQDPRHEEIVLLLAQPISERQFPEWSMAYIGPSQSAEEAVARTTRNLATSEAAEATRELLAFMSRMLQRNESGATPQA